MCEYLSKHRLWAENALTKKLKDSVTDKQAALELLRALMPLPADLQTAETVLQSGALDRTEIAIIAFAYVDYCFNFYHGLYLEDLSKEERFKLLHNPDPSLDTRFPGADMPEVFLLLLRYGLDPNAVFEGETLIDSVVGCCNGYTGIIGSWSGSLTETGR